MFHLNKLRAGNALHLLHLCYCKRMNKKYFLKEHESHYINMCWVFVGWHTKYKQVVVKCFRDEKNKWYLDHCRRLFFPQPLKELV